MKKILLGIVAIVLAMGLMPSRSESVPYPPPFTTASNRVTSSASPNRTDLTANVHGTDLGIMTEAPNGEMLLIFGDTFGPNNTDWRSNVLARSSDRHLSDGLALTSWAQDGKELIPSKKVDNDEMTVIPTAAVTVGNRVYMHYMSVKHWGPVGGQWTTNYAGIAYSDNNGETWVQTGTFWPNTGPGTVRQVAAFVQYDGYVYMYSTAQGRYGEVKLARVPEDQILVNTAWQYWNGSGFTSDWNATASVFSGISGEMSVARSNYLDKWIMLQTRCAPNGGLCEVVKRTSDSLTSGWSAASVVLPASTLPGSYAPYIHPWSAESESSNKLYYTLSWWSHYNVFLMETTL